jgi:hypothetical protein
LDSTKLTIRFLGPVRRPQGVGTTATLEVDRDATVESVLAALGYGEAERRRIRVLASGGTPVGLSERLDGAPELTIFLPLGGG